MSSIPGRGLFTNPPNIKVVPMGTCTNCHRLWPDCQCGKPNKRPSA